jgi:predicted enzyme related to lactoylglutathione lyase
MTRLRLGRVAPTIPVRDVEAASKFYEAALGCLVTFEIGTPINYAVLKKDDAEIHLARSADPAPRTQNIMHLLVNDADAAYARCRSAGATIAEELRDAPWGMRTFVFVDIDGHRIDVGQPLRA